MGRMDLMSGGDMDMGMGVGLVKGRRGCGIHAWRSFAGGNCGSGLGHLR
jgi:hypothetical protein